MASPSVRSKSAGEGTTGLDGSAHNLHVTLPATISAGDTLVVFICQDGTNLLEDGDSGFIYLITGETWYSPYMVAGGVFYKKADGTEGGTTVGFHGCANMQYAYVAYAFQDAADPYITAPTYSTMVIGADSTVEPGTCNPGVSKDYYWLAVAGCDWYTFNTYPSDMTLDRQRAGTSATYNASAAGAGAQSTASSFTPSGSFELTGNVAWIAWTVGIHPTGSTEVNMAGTIAAAATVTGDLGIVYAPNIVTAVTAILEIYDSTTDTWVDITKYLRTWDLAWGASGMLEQVRARTATFLLANNDRRFEPAYTSGPYADFLTIGAYIYFNLQVTTPAGTTVYPLFYGVAQAWRPTYSTPPASGDAVCILECCDPNLIIANDLCTLSLPAQTADLSIHDLLAERRWSGNIYEDFETGDSTLQAYDADIESILSVISSLVNSEGGWFFWQPGVRKITARFLNRSFFSLNHADETVYSMDDNNINGQYVSIVLSSDDDHLYTRARLTRVGGTVQNYLGSEATPLGERCYTAIGLLLASDAEVLDRARYIVESRTRVAYHVYCNEIEAVFAPNMPIAHSVHALGLTQPFAPVTVGHTPTVGAPLTFNCRVMGGRISQTQVGGLIRIRAYLVDSGVIGGDFWILQDAVKGLLGGQNPNTSDPGTTVLGW